MDSKAASSHTHKITTISAGYTFTQSSNSKIYYRTYNDEIKEEYGYNTFSSVGFNKQLGNLYFNDNGGNSFKQNTHYTYTTIYSISIVAEAAGALLGTTVLDKGSNYFRYWFWAGSNLTVNCAIHWHIIGK